MVTSSIPYAHPPSRSSSSSSVGTSPSAHARRTFRPPVFSSSRLQASNRSVASTEVAASAATGPIGAPERAQLTARLDELHRPYLELCRTDAEREDLRALMNRTIDHLAARGIGWPRLKKFFDFNQTMENTRCGMAGAGNAAVFGGGGLAADLLAAPAMASALESRGVEPTQRTAALGLVIGTGVLWADGVISPGITQGMLGPGYVPSDSVRPPADPAAPARFADAFARATAYLPKRTPAEATRQLQRSLEPYTARNQGLVAFAPALELIGTPKSTIDAAGPYAQNLLGLPCGAAGALLVASDERKSLHRSVLAHLYRLPADGGDPLDSLVHAIHRTENSSLRLQQLKEVATGVAAGGVGAATQLMIPPILAAERFGGIRYNDPRHGLVDKLVPPGIRRALDPATIVPALWYGATSAGLGVVRDRILGPAAHALTSPDPSTPDDARRDRMWVQGVHDITTAVAKKQMYNSLAPVAVRTVQAMQGVRGAASGFIRTPPSDPDRDRVHAAGMSVEAFPVTGEAPLSGVSIHGSRQAPTTAIPRGGLRGSVGSQDSIGSSASLVGSTRQSVDFPTRSPNPSAAGSVAALASKERSPVAPAIEMQRLRPKASAFTSNSA